MKKLQENKTVLRNMGQSSGCPFSMKGENNNGSKMEKGIFADNGCAYGSDYICTASICGTGQWAGFYSH